MCVWCVYACISHVCVCVRACACVRACVHARLCACVRGRAYTFSHPLPSSPSRPLSAWHAYTHTRVCLCVHTHVHTCRMGCSMEHCQGGGREQCGGVWLRSCRTVGQSFFLSLSRSHSLAHSLSRARSLALSRSLSLSLTLSRAPALSRVCTIPLTHTCTQVIQAAKLSGARRIIAIDTNSQKFSAARAMGATDCVDPSALDVPIQQHMSPALPPSSLSPPLCPCLPPHRSVSRSLFVSLCQSALLADARVCVCMHVRIK